MNLHSNVLPKFFTIWRVDCNVHSHIFQAYVCGQGIECVRHNSRAALQRAKENYDRFFAFVGILEHFTETVQLMEAVMPKFARGMTEKWRESGRL